MLELWCWLFSSFSTLSVALCSETWSCDALSRMLIHDYQWFLITTRIIILYLGGGGLSLDSKGNHPIWLFSIFFMMAWFNQKNYRWHVSVLGDLTEIITFTSLRVNHLKGGCGEIQPAFLGGFHVAFSPGSSRWSTPVIEKIHPEIEHEYRIPQDHQSFKGATFSKPPLVVSMLKKSGGYFKGTKNKETNKSPQKKAANPKKQFHLEI